MHHRDSHRRQIIATAVRPVIIAQNAMTFALVVDTIERCTVVSVVRIIFRETSASRALLAEAVRASISRNDIAPYHFGTDSLPNWSHGEGNGVGTSRGGWWTFLSQMTNQEN